MNINEIKEYLDANVENDEVKDFIKSLQNPITRDLVENWTKVGGIPYAIYIVIKLLKLLK